MGILKGGCNSPPLEKGNLMKKFKVRVLTPGFIHLPSGRKVRTPVVVNANERQLEAYKVQFKARGLSYKIEGVTEEDKFQESPSMSEKVIIEELTPHKIKKNAEPETFLDKLISEQEN